METTGSHVCYFIIHTLRYRYPPHTYTQMLDGNRREALQTLSMLVRATKNARVTLPKIAAHLAQHKIKNKSVVVRNSKTWKNPGTSRHARDRATVVKIEDGVATCQFERKELVYDVIHSKWECEHEVTSSRLKATVGTTMTNPGGNNKSTTYKSGTPVKIMMDGNWIDGEILGKSTCRRPKKELVCVYVLYMPCM